MVSDLPGEVDTCGFGISDDFFLTEWQPQNGAIGTEILDNAGPVCDISKGEWMSEAII